MRITELTPTDSRKSFYGKAKLHEYTSEGETFTDLISYNTRVAYYNHNTKQISINGYYSATTARHINAFLNSFGFDSLTKKQIENYKN